MPHDETPKRRPGHRWSPEKVQDDKGTEFVDPLAGPGTSSGSRWIAGEAKPQAPDKSDLKAAERRGSVLPNTGGVIEASANKVKRTEG